jgi:rubrerythrin
MPSKQNVNRADAAIQTAGRAMMNMPFLLKSFLFSDSKTRLRKVLYLGALMEQQAERFYRQLARQTQHRNLSTICLRLADEESNHFTLIETILSRWRSLPAVPDSKAIIAGEQELRRLFLNPPRDSADLEKFAGYALGEEQKMVDFYARFQTEFTNVWKLNRLREMIAEEEEHVRVWTEILAIA